MCFVITLIMAFSGKGFNTTGKPLDPKKERVTLKERFSALKHILPFLRLMWKCNPSMALSNMILRLLKASIPILTLYVAKLIIDEVVLLVQTQGDKDMTPLLIYVSIEFGLAVLSDILNRGIALLDGLLGEDGNRCFKQPQDHITQCHRRIAFPH